MLIKVLTPSYYPKLGGVSRFTTEVVESMSSKGTPVCVYTEKVKDRQKCNKVNILEYCGYRHFNKFTSLFLRNFMLLFHLFLDDKDTVYIISTWRVFGPICLLLRKKYHIVVHGSEVLEPLRNNRFRAWLLKKVLNNALSVFSNSHFTKSVVDQLLDSKKAIVVGCGINAVTAVTRHREPIGNRSILFVGTLSARKGVDDLIEAFAASKYRDETLVIVGKGPLEHALMKRVEEIGISNNVRFLSDLSEDELDSHFSTADLFIMLNKEIDGDYEGFGIVYLEAGKFGTPVIGCDNGGVPDAIENKVTGYICPSNNIGSVVEKLDSLYEDDSDWLSLSRNSVKLVNNRTWENVSDLIYKEVTSG